MAYRVELTPRAQRDFASLPTDAQIRIDKALRKLGTNPRPPGAVKLTGSDTYRIRAGSHRILYKVQDEVLLVLVVTIGHRRDVYR